MFSALRGCCAVACPASPRQTPVTYDSNGVLRGLVVRWDAVWVPLLDVNRLPGKDQRSESYWPVGVTDTEFICVVCKVRGPTRAG